MIKGTKLATVDLSTVFVLPLPSLQYTDTLNVKHHFLYMIAHTHLKNMFAYVVLPLPYVHTERSVFLPFEGNEMLCCRMSTTTSFVSTLEKTISAVDEGVKFDITQPPSIRFQTI